LSRTEGGETKVRDNKEYNGINVNEIKEMLTFITATADFPKM
jgi:hypothetical protein